MLVISMRTTALSGACAVCVRVPGNRRASSWRCRLLLPILLIYPVCLLVLEGCADLAVAESTAMVDWQPPDNVPMTIRTLNADGRFSQVSCVAAAERLRAQHPGEPLNILALSGGGALWCLRCWGCGRLLITRAGSRPDFTVVNRCQRRRANSLLTRFWDPRGTPTFSMSSPVHQENNTSCSHAGSPQFSARACIAGSRCSISLMRTSATK